MTLNMKSHLKTNYTPIDHLNIYIYLTNVYISY